jgi:hypothetical protein
MCRKRKSNQKYKTLPSLIKSKIQRVTIANLTIKPSNTKTMFKAYKKVDLK